MRTSNVMRAAFAVGFLGLAISGCSDSRQEKLHLLGNSEVDEAERARLRALQTMKVVSVDANGDQTEIGIPIGTFADVEASSLPVAAYEKCEADLALSTTDLCTIRAFYGAIQLCSANLFLELATFRAKPVQLAGPASGETYLIGAQSTPVSAALARYASFKAYEAFQEYQQTLRWATGSDPGGCDLALEMNPGLTAAEVIGGGFVDAYTTYREAIDVFTRNTVASSDAQLSSTASLTQGTSWAISATALSRAAAVHSLVGGDPGLFGSTTVGGTDWCAVPEPTPSVRAAIEVFREAGTDPADILANETDLPLTTLLESQDDCMGTCSPAHNSVSPLFSVRERLADRWGQEDTLLTTSTPTLLEFFNLTKADFQAAREYLASEIKAFSRTRTATLPPPPKAGGGTVNVPLFAGVATLPPVRPPQYFAALAKQGALRPQFPTGNVPDPYALDLSSFVDWALTSASYELASGSLPGAVPAASKSQLLDPVAALVAESQHDRVGRLTVDHSSMGITFWANGLGAGDDARIVRGEDGLACATTGSIEGAVCDVHSSEVTVSDLPNQSFGYNGFTQTVSGTWYPSMGESLYGRFYLVRRKPSASGGNIFEAVVGFTFSPASGDYTESYPIVLSAERRAGELLAPDRNWCSRTRVTCAGVEMDARIPLEDELSDDSNGVENSWRHYIDVARRSARDADALGEAVLDSGTSVTSTELDIAGRTELALEEVQKLCGADIDIEQLRSILGANGGLENLRTESSCTTDAECSPPAALPPGADPSMNYHCSGGFCVGDLVATISAAADKHPAIQRIAECLDPGNVRDFVTPGSQNLCVWVDKNDPTSVPVCDGHSAGFPCPVPGPNGCDDLETPDNVNHSATFVSPTYDKVSITTTLGYFDYVDGSNAVPQGNPCETIRHLRRYGGQHWKLSELTSSEFFHPATFESFARQVSFEPRFNSHSAIKLGGAPVFQTGQDWTGTSTGWPCAPLTGITCQTSGDPSLMCAVPPTGICATKELRAPFNRRLLNAVAALRAMVAPPNEVDAEQSVYTQFPARGDYVPAGAATESINIFTRSRPGPPVQAPVEVHEVVFKKDPRKFTFYYVNGPPADQQAWTDYSCAGGNCSIVDHFASPGFPFVVVEDRPPQQCGGTQGCSKPWFGGLSSAWSKYKGVFYEHLDSPGLGLPALKWVPSTEAFPFITHFGATEAGASYLGTGINDSSKQVSMDALELACEVARSGASACDLSNPPNIAVEGWPAAKRYMDCAANEIQRRGALTIYADFPTKAIDALRKESKLGAFPALGGTYGAAVSRLRAGLVEISEVTPLVASELRSLGSDFEQVETSVALSNIQKEKNEIQFEATTANQVAQCLASTFQSFGVGAKDNIVFNPGQGMAAAVTCANSFVQIKFAGKLKDLGSDEANLLAEQARLNFRQRFETHATNLQTFSARLTKASDEIDASLSELQTMRDQARRALYRALLDSSTVGKKQATLLAIGKARFGTAQRRYEAARHNAVLAAFIAKRSVEARLGVRLSSLKEDLPLVAAPASWESTVCSSSGLSFDDIVREGGAKDYADAYIGDYVDKLENVVESYRLVNNFHEGTDTAVVSLKDDFNRVKKNCPTAVNNLLYHAGDFSKAGVYPVGSAVEDFASLPAGQWALAGCVTGLPDCVGISALGEDGAPFTATVKKLSDVRGYRITYGPDSGTCGGTCGYQADAYLAQRVELVPGKYRLSWHTRQPSGGLDGVALATLSGPAVTALGSEGSQPVGTQGWYRRWRLFDVSEGGTHAVLIGPPGAAGGAVDLAAVMLENAPGAIDTDEPPTFANTGDTLTRMLPTCADTDGGVFRATKWRRGCVQLCADGFAASCDGAAAQTYCYRETLVSFSQADIDSGRVFGASGIAKGNFNYRVERVGVNFVGTGLRSCESSSSPQSCFGSGYWTYSLQHGGPYHVRNYSGQDVPVQLFTGNIEHARGLAAERYLTNPMSSADNELMSTYMRREFQGRPLDGTFVLRVWEEPGLNFDALEDVQLALEYRYWTRFK